MRLARAMLLLVATSLLGCGTIGLSLDELPNDPIAVTWWAGEDARRRAELLDDREDQLEKARRYQRGVAEAGTLGRLFGLGEEPDGLERYPGRLALIDPHSLEVTVVRAAPQGSLPLAWSEDREKLLFLSNHRDGIQVYEYLRSTGEVHTVTSGRHPHVFADYGLGPQLVLLQVVTEEKRRFERVLVTDAKGHSPEVVFENRQAEIVRLSPDGETLVFVQRSPPRPGSLERRSNLVSLNLRTGQEQPLGPGREPSFSPTGDWIVYSAPSRDGWRLRRMRSDGSARSSIASGIRDEKQPSVSPDGRFVVYVGETNGLERLFVRRLDGTGDRILLDAGAVFAPAW